MGLFATSFPVFLASKWFKMLVRIVRMRPRETYAVATRKANAVGLVGISPMITTYEVIAAGNQC